METLPPAWAGPGLGGHAPTAPRLPQLPGTPCFLVPQPAPRGPGPETGGGARGRQTARLVPAHGWSRVCGHAARLLATQCPTGPTQGVPDSGVAAGDLLVQRPLPLERPAGPAGDPAVQDLLGSRSPLPRATRSCTPVPRAPCPMCEPPPGSGSGTPSPCAGGASSGSRLRSATPGNWPALDRALPQRRRAPAWRAPSEVAGWKCFVTLGGPAFAA